MSQIFKPPQVSSFFAVEIYLLVFFSQTNHRGNRTEIFNSAGLEVMVLLGLLLEPPHNKKTNAREKMDNFFKRDGGKNMYQS